MMPYRDSRVLISFFVRRFMCSSFFFGCYLCVCGWRHRCFHHLKQVFVRTPAATPRDATQRAAPALPRPEQMPFNVFGYVLRITLSEC